MDLLVSIIGIGLIVYFVLLLGGTRLAIRKGFNAKLMFLVAMVLPPVALILVLLILNKNNIERDEKDTFTNIIWEVTQPFIDLVHTSRALLGLNFSYILEGLTYFGVVGLLAIYFNEFIQLDDIRAGNMVGVLTAGITLSMLFLGATVDIVGVRKALLYALSFMLVGRIFLSTAPHLGTPGLWGSGHIYAMLGILGIVIGYGMYQPAAYAAVKKFTNENTAAMGYAMLYALMNLGGYLPGLISPPVRREAGILGVFWVYAALTVAGIAVVYFIMTKKAVASAIETASKDKNENQKENEDELSKMSAKEKLKFYLKNFPLKDKRFLFFIFILIPVQTLFAHNWLTIPLYTSRAFDGFVQNNFEFFVNLNPILIFVLTPMIAALTSKKNAYTMMIIGTFVMASPTFILALGPGMGTLLAYLIIMTIGEAMWQPRFLQWVAEIAPKNMTGIYMGIGQFPWFLTKVVTSLYSGWFLMQYCPADTPPAEMNTEFMWLVYGFIAVITPISLLLARKWMVKGFKTKHEV
ncbi:MAG TPA: MFS transporter [Melioribacteraceae bacterium]|nr:MFS transporter [Melioribacteraceae bacterium]